jgi:hypothetical protein
MAGIYASKPLERRICVNEDSFYVIVSLIHEEPVIKAFEIKDGFVAEVEII